MLQNSLLLSCQLAFMSMSFLQQSGVSDFKDPGKLLIGGFVLAVAAGIAFTVVRLRLRDKKPPAAQFISINASERKRDELR